MILFIISIVDSHITDQLFFPHKSNTSLLHRIEGTCLKVIVENEEQIELSFTRMWDASVQGQQAPLFIDRRFSLLSCLNFYLII